MIPGGVTMKTTEEGEKVGFHDALAFPGRAPEIPKSADIYGWLISWELDVYHY
jgi:hypothetical protein